MGGGEAPTLSPEDMRRVDQLPPQVASGVASGREVGRLLEEEEITVQPSSTLMCSWDDYSPYDHDSGDVMWEPADSTND